MQKEKKELLHIQVKDNGLLISEKIGNTLADTRATLERDILGNLISGADETSLTRYKIAQNLRLRAFKVETNKVINETKKSVKNALKKDTTVNLNNKQINKVSNEVNVGLNALGNNAVKTYQNTLNSVFLQVKAAKDLKEQLQKHINSGVNIGVVYKDGKNYKFDSYYEMKSRTDIQTYIGENMVSAGNAAGVIFYIAAYFGDCAKDHVDYQGKIYVDKDWEESAPADRVDEIRNYINQHNVKTVQEIMDAPYYFTTRPNCRHYFQYVDIDSVLGAKTNKEVSTLRDKMNLNFNGKYQPEKYEALQKQRLNERMIRAKKEEVTKYEQQLSLDVGNKELRSKILNGEASIRHYQAKQRQLEKQYSNIERSYMREQVGNRVDFNVSKNLTNKANNANIEVDDVAQASIYSAKSTLLYKNARNIKPIDGYFDITCHSDGLKFSYKNDLGKEEEFNVFKMIKYIKKDKTYQEGTPIRLISCYAGNEILAQTIANQLNVNVMAPTDVVNIYPDGTMKLGEYYQKTHVETGEWLVFKPEKGGSKK